MKNNIENYIEERCREILKKVGVEEGQIILDFGCGGGNYTIPAAKIIGNEGKVYAVDEDGYKLKDLEEKAKSANLSNIEIIRTSLSRFNLRIINQYFPKFKEEIRKL